MLGVDAKQGAPKDGNSPIELFQVIKAIFFFNYQQLSAMPTNKTWLDNLNEKVIMTATWLDSIRYS